MDHEETRRPGLMGYDERTETWYVRSADSQRFMLTRQSLARLIELYNSVHTGRPVVLVEEREIRSLQESRRRAEDACAALIAAHQPPPDRGSARRLLDFAACLPARLGALLRRRQPRRSR